MSKPPAGQAHWTLQILTQTVLEDGIVNHTLPQTARSFFGKGLQDESSNFQANSVVWRRQGVILCLVAW